MTRPDSPQWLAAKADGDRAEMAVAAWFTERGYSVFRTLGMVAFDLLLQCQVEVKRDKRASETGNVAIEVRHNGQPSGILTTLATWWAIVLDDEAVILKADALRECVLTGDFREVTAGDRFSTAVKLLPVERLKGIRTAFTVALQEAP